jgi:hypothetical protein
MDIMIKVLVLAVVGLIILVTLLGEFRRRPHRPGRRLSPASAPIEKEMSR